MDYFKYPHCGSKFTESPDYPGSESDKKTDADIVCQLREGHRSALCAHPFYGREWRKAGGIRIQKLLKDGCPHPRSDGQICRGVINSNAHPLHCGRCYTRFCSACGGTSGSRFNHDAAHDKPTEWPDCFCADLRVGAPESDETTESKPAKPLSTPQPFNPEAVCPKCTSRDISMKHCPSHSQPEHRLIHDNKTSRCSCGKWTVDGRHVREAQVKEYNRHVLKEYNRHVLSADDQFACEPGSFLATNASTAELQAKDDKIAKLEEALRFGRDHLDAYGLAKGDGGLLDAQRMEAQGRFFDMARAALRFPLIGDPK